MLTPEQKAFYAANGYLVLPGYLADMVDEANGEIERLCVPAAKLDRSDDRLDLEDSHTRDDPRVRRVKRPDLQSALFDRLMRSDRILGLARDLIGPNIRLHTTKLNMKRASYGAPVEWHQDFAFYPCTNADVLAIGIVFDDMAEENGPLQVIPGSHRGPILDHHANGVFAGACDITEGGYTLADAVSMSGPAGTVSIHHGHVLHGSATNRSARDRRMLFFEMMAADAFPIGGSTVTFGSLEEYDAKLLCGEPTIAPRLEPVSVRIPQPQPETLGSIYEIQKAARGAAA